MASCITKSEYLLKMQCYLSKFNAETWKQKLLNIYILKEL